MRIKKTDAEARENFMLDTFKKDPEMSIAKANKLLHDKFGSQMRAVRAYELRDIAKKEVAKPTQSTAQTAARKANKPKAVSAGRMVNPQPAAQTAVGENKNRLVVLEGSSENIEFLKSAIESINDAGLAGITVDLANNKYAIIRS